MRKFIVLLLIMIPFISSVQAQNCQIRPSCAELGYTKTVELCEGQAYLTCPFDESQVYCPFDCEPKDCSEYILSECPAKGICEECVAGCGDKTSHLKLVSCEDGYEPTIAKNRCRVKVEGLIAFTIEATPTEDESSTVKLTLNGGCDGYVDWGDGTAQDVSTSSVSHTYSEGGTYEIKLGASISRFALSTFTNANPISLQQLNLATVTDMSGAFNGRTTITGSIPELPSALENGANMFNGCFGLTGNVPELPDSLKNGQNMFLNCSGLTGVAPTMPSSLTSYTYIFAGTQITNNETTPWPDNAW